MFLKDYKHPKFLLPVETSIGIGNLIGRNIDASEFLISFAREKLTDSYISEHPEVGSNIHIWLKAEEIYRIAEEKGKRK